MILLIFAVLSLTLISLWLVNELYDTNKLLKEEKEMSEMIRRWADAYWQYYVEACDRNRDLNKELDIYYEANKDLQNQLADSLHEAESFRELAKERSEEIEKQEERIKFLQYDLENEFEWSMKYSESAERYSALYFDSLEESSRIKGELEQTQETLNMLEHGYQLLKEENEELQYRLDSLDK